MGEIELSDAQRDLIRAGHDYFNAKTPTEEGDALTAMDRALTEIDRLAATVATGREALWQRAYPDGGAEEAWRHGVVDWDGMVAELLRKVWMDGYDVAQRLAT